MLTSPRVNTQAKSTGTGPILAALLATTACAMAGCSDPVGPTIADEVVHAGAHANVRSAQVDYSMRELPSPSWADECWANDISSSGVVVGGCRQFDGAGDEDLARAIVWSRDEIHILPSLGGYETNAVAISDRGHIVGTSRTPDGQGRAVLWRSHATIEDLGGAPDAIQSIAYDVNNRGQVVITSWNTHETRGLVWERGSLTDLGDLGGGTTVPSAINARGQVAGYSHVDAVSRRAFVWEDGVMRDLGTLGGDFSWANGINDGGDVVGWSLDSARRTRAFLWKDGEMGELVVAVSDFTRAHDVNPSGIVVGFSWVFGSSSRAVAWVGAETVNLDVWNTTSEALAANARGQIVGNAVAPDWSGMRAVVWER